MPTMAMGSILSAIANIDLCMLMDGCRGEIRGSETSYGGRVLENKTVPAGVRWHGSQTGKDGLRVEIK
jgi:hypothetical protein